MNKPNLTKEQSSKKARTRKRLLLLITLFVLLVSAYFLPIWLLAIMLIGGFVINETYFSDHIFYQSKQDYIYNLQGDKIAAQIVAHKLRYKGEITPNSTIFLAVKLKANLLGYLFDPYVKIGDDKQYFEKGAGGIRFLNLTGQKPLGLVIKGYFCQIAAHTSLHICPDFALDDQKIMIIAPHADDAEIAAFGLYSSNAANVSIITLSQGEVEADFYQSKFKLNASDAAKLKGQIRSFDSVSAPIWGGVKTQNCLQLGYFCLRLSEMQQKPKQAFSSLEAQSADIRSARKFNALKLPADKDGLCTWHNLVADLAACIEHFAPQIVITPHLEFDAHPDHIAATNALKEALSLTKKQPAAFLLYANHLTQHDLLPLGKQGYGTPLPPAFFERKSEHIFSFYLDKTTQINKKISLDLMSDLQNPLSFKKTMRRILQTVLTNRTWQNLREDEFMRKAVRRHENFWLQTKL